ncbi:hypothetical protein K503DRAFT_781035 [Rhizopogon vinicolor AM-OR11-026]|uniref:Uncharacterized protein n=1 Tax=Rhizopogon vinicolor AM-OR11-026 TaxID=1314800 RepID=A0A1B7N7Y0_9AGAM|nr:hypothetical protein K503DRAFT_781035 [Rhizopogon vinicolor AM-OR11-026]
MPNASCLGEMTKRWRIATDINGTRNIYAWFLDETISDSAACDKTFATTPTRGDQCRQYGILRPLRRIISMAQPEVFVPNTVLARALLLSRLSKELNNINVKPNATTEFISFVRAKLYGFNASRPSTAGPFTAVTRSGLWPLSNLIGHTNLEAFQLI